MILSPTIYNGEMLPLLMSPTYRASHANAERGIQTSLLVGEQYFLLSSRSCKLCCIFFRRLFRGKHWPCLRMSPSLTGTQAATLCSPSSFKTETLLRDTKSESAELQQQKISKLQRHDYFEDGPSSASFLQRHSSTVDRIHLEISHMCLSSLNEKLRGWTKGKIPVGRCDGTCRKAIDDSTSTSSWRIH
jgi:hypothetical protein